MRPGRRPGWLQLEPERLAYRHPARRARAAGLVRAWYAADGIGARSDMRGESPQAPDLPGNLLWRRSHRKWGALAAPSPRGKPGNRRKFAIYRDAAMRPSPVMVWTPEQAGQFLDAVADHRLYPLLHLVVYRGFRRGELCGLPWRDVDLDTARITVQTERVQLGWKAVESPVKSEASDAPVAIDADTVAVLRAWRRAQLAERLAMGEHWTDTGLVFTLEDGTAYHPDRLTDIFEWEAFMAGLPPIRFHDLRHCAASIAHAAGASMKDIQALLRHSSLTITADLYTSVFEDLATDLAEQMARVVPRQRTAGDWRPTDAPTTRPQTGLDPREQPSWP